MNRRPNWPIWAGFLLSVIAFASYFFFFVNFPVTRDFPWVNLLLFGLAAAFLFAGLRRAFLTASSYRRKIFGSILAGLSVAVFAFFAFTVFVASKRLPAAHGAPQVGQKAPEFSLRDADGNAVSLTELLTAPLNSTNSGSRAPKGVVLIFYRGYW